MNMMTKFGDCDNVGRACTVLGDGGVVVIPTETVYGLAADATNGVGVARIYEIKRRPSFNPLIVHVRSLEAALEVGLFSKDATALAKAFWRPGTPCHRPLTIVVRVREEAGISALVTTGLDTVGVRVPDHPITQAILQQYKKPLAAPSANVSQRLSATNVDIVRKTLGHSVPLIIDGGQCGFGVESTIVDASGDEFIERGAKAGEAADFSAPVTVLRPGGTTIEEISNVLGYEPKVIGYTAAIKAPGMLRRHYAPSIPLKMNQTAPVQQAAFLGFAGCDYGEYNLSKSGDLKEAASNLFRMLFEVDNPAQYNEILVAPIPLSGLGLAINDRLKRAAS